MGKEDKKLCIGLCTIIVILTFALGFMCNKSGIGDETVFTKEELTTIMELQQREDDKNSGAQVYAYKDKKGNLFIGWSYDGKKK